MKVVATRLESWQDDKTSQKGDSGRRRDSGSRGVEWQRQREGWGTLATMCRLVFPWQEDEDLEVESAAATALGQ